MRFPRYLAAGVVISAGLHAAGSALLADDPNEMSLAASQGGAVSVIGSIEDLVAGSKADTVEVTEPVEEVEPVTEPIEPVQEPVEVAQITPPVSTAVVEPVTAARQPDIEPVQPVTEAVSVPIIAGVTSTETVTAVETSEETLPEETEPDRPIAVETKTAPVSAVEAQPVEVAKAVESQQIQPIEKAEPISPAKPIEVAKLVEIVEPLELQEPLAEPLEAVTATPTAKPAVKVKKPAPQKQKVTKKKTAEKKKKVAKAQKKGADRNARKGGERITSKKGKSNANGRADATSNDGGLKEKTNYKGKVYRKVQRAKRGVRNRLKGVVHVSFVVARSGSVSGIRISRSSGNAKLDTAARDMVRRAAPMPKFPENLRLKNWKFTIPVKFD